MEWSCQRAGNSFFSDNDRVTVAIAALSPWKALLLTSFPRRYWTNAIWWIQRLPIRKGTSWKNNPAVLMLVLSNEMYHTNIKCCTSQYFWEIKHWENEADNGFAKHNERPQQTIEENSLKKLWPWNSFKQRAWMKPTRNWKSVFLRAKFKTVGQLHLRLQLFEKFAFKADN